MCVAVCKLVNFPHDNWVLAEWHMKCFCFWAVMCVFMPVSIRACEREVDRFGSEQLCEFQTSLRSLVSFLFMHICLFLWWGAFGSVSNSSNYGWELVYEVKLPGHRDDANVDFMVNVCCFLLCSSFLILLLSCAPTGIFLSSDDLFQYPGQRSKKKKSVSSHKDHLYTWPH